MEGKQQVAAGGTDEKAERLQAPAGALLLRQAALHQRLHIHPQGLRQSGQQGNIRRAAAPLPFGNGLVADADALCQRQLGQALPAPQGADQAPGLDLVHTIISFSLSIAETAALCKKRSVERRGPGGAKNSGAFGKSVIQYSHL